MSFSATDLLWLLLPLAAASGWLAARFEQKRHARQSLDLPSAYFKGLNFLLNEQPDKAIEVFIRVLEVNSDTVETHLALGNLFRRRGEVERAIRIHQNLIARPTLDKEQRSQALLELGQDYFKAGLFDRAENLFLELAEIRAHSEQALRLLLHIYQQEKEWEKAISVVRKLARASGRNLNNMIAHFYCELAEQDIARNNRSSARDRLKQALTADDKCVRASILLGDVDAAEGNHHRAIEQWQRIEQQDIHYLGEVAERIAVAFRKLGDEQGLYDYFQVALRRHGGVSFALAFADVIGSREGVEAAEKFIIEWLRRTPNVHGLHKLLELNLVKAKDSARNDLLMLKGIIEELRTQHLGYACGECGFKGKALHWLCPGCNHWNTIKPVQEE
ncbi:MAG: lipopolysaccharide assembly protein LapB [Gammaproteobacteria bacterium]|nr:lipopolysaccharide assembly protein LapB [Gammaproteobacteria bacterium]